MTPTSLRILHFNDVYRVTKQNVEGGTIDVAQWAQMLDECRSQWPEDGLVLFSGDAFSPSVESSVTRGSHMVPILNAIGIDCAVAGNHDFDWSAPHFSKLVKDSTYPWLLSNIIDEDIGRVPEGLREFQVIERAGLRIGIVGLVEEDWIKTISSWPSNYKYQDMEKVALRLSKQLRDPEGPYKCDIVIALTHSRLPNDIRLAQAIYARIGPDCATRQGCDIILGGHDHFYYVSKYGPGATSWEGYDVTSPLLGAEGDDGVLVIKSGTDFRDLSEMCLEITEAPPGSVRKYFISAVKGIRHSTKPGSKSSEKLTEILNKVVGHIEGSLSKPVCKLDAVLDCRSDVVRIAESASGNWFADVIFHAYDDASCVRKRGGADAVFICGGTIRGDSRYGPGYLTVGNIMEILPFQDPIVVLEMDGSIIWTALESSLATWPAQEGRFPIVSGLRVQWDSSKPRGQRVLSVALLEGSHDTEIQNKNGQELEVKESPISREPGGQMYTVVTRLYMAQGFDGYDAFKDCKFLVDDENGRIMSDLVRAYLMGSQYINSMMSLSAQETPAHLSKHTGDIIASEQRRHAANAVLHGKSRWAEIVRQKVIKPSKRQACNSFHVAGKENMSSVDCVDGENIRGGQQRQEDEETKMRNQLVIVSPRIDGRLLDVGRP